MFSSIIEAWDNDPVKEMTNKIKNKKDQTHTSDNLSLSLTNDTLSLFSEQNKISSKENYKLLSDNIELSLTGTDCKNCIVHFKKCQTCATKLNNLINKKVQINMDKLILDEKLKSITVTKNVGMEIWKSPIIIIAAIVILILILYILFKK